MKILYGIQGTGNGHITRARALTQHFANNGVEADFLFSGRERNKYFDMEVFGDNWISKRGLTFVHNAGKLSILKTIGHASLKTLHNDIHALDLSPYDAIITDFEPITAWAAKRQGKPCIGIGHQYAFEHSVPRAGDSIISRQIMERFAPAEISLGLHWHHFNAPILPPIAETHSIDESLIEEDRILVYFGFENQDDVLQMLEKHPEYTFILYGPFQRYESVNNVQLKPFSREGFKQDLAICNGVISNAGFELSSEAIQLGKKLLVKPLMGQMEQQSNAKALEELGLGLSMKTLDAKVVGQWLSQFNARRIRYPDVAKAIVEWVSKGRWDHKDALIESLWENTVYDQEAPSKAKQKTTLPPVKPQREIAA